MKIIDSHCHLDDFFYDGRINEVLENAEHALVTKMIAVGTHGKDWQFYSEFVKSRGNIFYTVGLHPLLVSEHLRDIELLGEFLGEKSGPVAIGEIGLDYHRLPEDQMLREAEIKLQQRIFREQLAS
ncbi:MAG: TatD family hydrolase, partial [Puniceicoccales bacterium]|nr:TatD family hydrolase [Puniceicoccales bacterium]